MSDIATEARARESLENSNKDFLIPVKKKEVVKLNLGCGANKFPGFVNIDVEPTVEPDVLLDFKRSRLPYKDEVVAEVWMCHTIEHIEKTFHQHLFSEVNRVLKPNGMFVLTFPNFKECIKNYLENKQGKRDFWEATIYGYQRHPGDYHVAAIDPLFLSTELKQYGFREMKSCPESQIEPFNHFLAMAKSYNTITKEDLVKQEYL